MTLIKLFAVITRTNRYRPEFEWSTKSWTHNVFRAYEMILGRKEGLRIESTAKASFRKGTVTVTRKFFTVEARISHMETALRELFAYPVLEFAFVKLPALVTPQGDLFSSLYRFAFVIENHTLKVGAPATSFSYTATGSNRVMVSGVWVAGSTSPSNTPTYNSVSMVNAGVNISSASVNVSLTGFTLINPSTGANTWACSGVNDSEVVTFTGAHQSIQPDASSKVNTEGSQTNTTLSVTTVTDNCMALSFFGNSTATTPSAGSGSTLLDQELSSLFATVCSNSTNPITPTGPYFMTTNHAASTGNYMAILAIKPFSAVTVGFRALLGVGN